MKKKEIRNLLIVLGGGVLTAFLIAWLFIHRYGPSGSYEVSKALLDPAIIKQLEASSVKGKNRFIVDKITFSYFDGPQMKTIHVSQKKYEAFYQIVKGDKSMPSAEIAGIFHQTPAGVLSFLVKGENKPLQQIEFAESGDFYRIRSLNEDWIYVRHSKIYPVVLELFQR